LKEFKQVFAFQTIPMELPQNAISLFEHLLGKMKCQALIQHLASVGFADNKEDGVTRASVEEALLDDIVIPGDANPSSPEFDKAMEEADAIQAFFACLISGMCNPALALARAEATPVNHMDISMTRGSGSAQFSFCTAGEGGAAATDTGEDDEEDATPQTFTKRARFCMSNAELASACTVMNLPTAQAMPEFLKDRPLDVQLYTRRLIYLYMIVRQTKEAI
jgi:hypothetical protein